MSGSSRVFLSAAWLASIAALLVLVVAELQHASHVPFAIAAVFAAVGAALSLRAPAQRGPAVGALVLAALALAAFAFVVVQLGGDASTRPTGALAVSAWLAPLVAGAAVLPLAVRAELPARLALAAGPAGAAISAALSLAILVGMDAPIPLVRDIDVVTLAGELIALAAVVHAARSAPARRADA